MYLACIAVIGQGAPRPLNPLGKVLRCRAIPFTLHTVNHVNHRRSNLLLNNYKCARIKNRLQLLWITNRNQLTTHFQHAALHTLPVAGPDHTGLIHEEDKATLCWCLPLGPTRLPSRQTGDSHTLNAGQSLRCTPRNRTTQNLKSTLMPNLRRCFNCARLTRTRIARHKRQTLLGSHLNKRLHLIRVQALTRNANISFTADI